VWLLSHTQVVSLLTHSAPPPLMTFPWNCLMCPKSSLKDSPTLMLYKLVGSGMKEKLSMCRFMDSPWRKYRSKESPAGVVVEVLGIRILHLANLHCGRRRMTFMSGSGRSRNYSLCGKKEKPTDLYLIGFEIHASTVSPSSQTQPACITWGLASCWGKTLDTWGRFCLRKKWQMWLHSPKSETETWEEIGLRPTSAQEWTNRTLISHEPMICSKMCFATMQSVQ